MNNKIALVIGFFLAACAIARETAPATSPVASVEPSRATSAQALQGGLSVTPTAASSPTASVSQVPTPLLTETPICLASPHTPDYAAVDQAKDVLIEFFDLLNERQYEAAAGIYGGTYTVLQDSNPDIDLTDHGSLLKRSCEVNGYQCLRISRIVQQQSLTSSEHVFVVEFLRSDGSQFVRGPCCGGDATQTPPESEFRYLVVRDCEGQYRVMDLPPYVP